MLRLSLQQCQQDQQIGKANVLDIEEEIGIHQPSAAPVVAPVELEPQEVIAFRCLHEGEAQKLGQGQGCGNGPVQKPWAEPLPAARLVAVPEHTVEAASQRQKHQRQIAVGVQKGQPARHHAKDHQRPGLVLFASA